jgi:feruloyl esterase
MRGLGSTTARLAGYRKTWEKLAAATAQGAPAGAAVPNHLAEVTGFGSNPGALRLFLHVPERRAPRPALVVVLHGCTQNAAGYDRGAGWSQLADRHGFIALFPEQQAANNPRTCFNWFETGDIARGRGEALSIHEMIEHVAQAHDVDRSRIFVTGLSAGGAMAGVMLATYPEVFAGGAIIAGLPYGAAGNVQEALDAMFQGQARAATERGDKVRAASRHRGPWPKVSVWHGSTDTTVKPVNADEIVKQWTNVHGLPERPSREETVSGYPRRVWCGPDGEVLVESYTITGMAHGTPLSAGTVGAAGPFLLDVGISSTEHIAAFWGLSGAAPAQTAAPRTDVPQPSAAATPPRIRVLDGEVLPPGSEAGAGGFAWRSAKPGPGAGTGPEAPGREKGAGPGGRGGIDPGRVIADALRAAGLMRR